MHLVQDIWFLTLIFLVFGFEIFFCHLTVMFTDDRPGCHVSHLSFFHNLYPTFPFQSISKVASPVSLSHNACDKPPCGHISHSTSFPQFLLHISFPECRQGGFSNVAELWLMRQAKSVWPCLTLNIFHTIFPFTLYKLSLSNVVHFLARVWVRWHLQCRWTAACATRNAACALSPASNFSSKRRGGRLMYWRRRYVSCRPPKRRKKMGEQEAALIKVWKGLEEI